MSETHLLGPSVLLSRVLISRNLAEARECGHLNCQAKHLLSYILCENIKNKTNKNQKQNQLFHFIWELQEPSGLLFSSWISSGKSHLPRNLFLKHKVVIVSFYLFNLTTLAVFFSHDINYLCFSPWLILSGVDFTGSFKETTFRGLIFSIPFLLHWNLYLVPLEFKKYTD